MPIIVRGPEPEPTRKKESRSFGGLLSNALGDIPQLGHSLLIDLPTALARGQAHTLADISRAVYGGRPQELLHTEQRLANVLSGVNQTVDTLTPSIGPLRWLDEHQIMGRNPATGKNEFWFKVKDKNDVQDAVEAWYNDPLINALNVLPGVGLVGRAGSLAKLTTRISEANTALKLSDVRRLAVTESKNPGALAAAGIKGGISPRELRVSVPGGEGSRTVTLPRSGSPLGRGLESLYDVGTKRSPFKTLSEEARAARFEKRQGGEKLREQEAQISGLARPVVDLAYRYGGIRNFLAGRMETTPEAAALTTLLQLPKELTTKQALEAHLAAREQTLAEGVYMKAVHQSLDDIPDPEKWLGTTVRVGNPNRGDVYQLKSLDHGDQSAVVTRQGTPHVVDFNEVFPVKKSGNAYTSAFREPVPLDETARNFIRAEMGSLRRTLEHPPNQQEFEQALGSLQRMSDLVETYGFFINGRNLNGAQRLQLAQRYARRKQLLVNDLVARGLIPEGMEARGYFPHFAIWRSLAANWTGPVRLPSSGLVIGKARKAADVTRARTNDLVLHQLGQVNLDPSALMYLLSMRMRYAESFLMRKDYYDIAVPMDKAPTNQGGYLIRDPDKAAQTISDRTKAELNLSDKEYAKLVHQGEDTASILDDPQTVAAEPRDWLASEDGPKPDWTREEGVRWLPAHVVEARFGRRVFRGEAPSMLGLANGLARFALIIGRPLRYAMSNIPSNVLMLAATNPDALLQATKLIGQAATRSLPKGVDRDLLEMIRAQGGEVRATAGIPQFSTMRVRPLEKGEAWTSRQSSRLADVMGTLVDEPFRIAAWMSRARKMGFSDPEDWRRLLTASHDSALGKARQQIRQRTRDDLLDFNSLTQWEREQATRYLFVWPYMRAAMKWPMVYARERPIASGLLAATAAQAPHVPLPLPIASAQGSSEVEIGGHRYDLSQLNPLSPFMEASGTARRLARGDVTAAADYLSPAIRQVAAAVTGSGGSGSGSDALQQLIATFVPVAPFARNLMNNGWQSALAEEALRFTPRKPYRYIRRDKRDEMESIVHAYGNVFSNPLFARSFSAYWTYRDLAARSQIAAQERYGRKKLSPAEQRMLLQQVWARYFGDMQFPQVPVTQDENDVIAGNMFGARDYLAHGLPDGG